MRKYTKFLVLILALLLLAGCSGKQNDAPSASAPASSAPANSPAPAPANNAPAPSTPSVIGEGGSETGTFVRQTAEGTLTIGVLGSIEGFDPAFSNNGIGMGLVYETLFVFNPDKQALEPLLVDTYEYLDDTTLKLVLKDNIYFSNGDKLTAQDVIYSLHRYIDVASNLSTYVDVYDYNNTIIENDLTLILKYKQPFGPGINYLSGQFTILDKNYVESTGDSAFWDAPVGTGPYALVENVSGSHANYTLRGDYWGAPPEPREITVRSYSEPSTMFIDFENGVLDMVFEVGANDVNRLLAGGVEDCGYTIQSIRDVYMLCLPEYVPYFQDIRVRQALAHALDTEQIAAAALDCLAMPATSVLPEGVMFKIDVGTYDYDPELSKSLLAEAGYPNGFTLDMVITQDPVSPVMTESIQYYLEEVGITLNIHPYDFPVAVPMFMRGETDMVLKNAMGGATLREPDQILDTLKASSTAAAMKISDPVMDGYLMNGLYSTDEATRRQNYENAQKWIFDNVTDIPICEAAKCFAYRNYVSLNTTSVQYPSLVFVHFK